VEEPVVTPPRFVTELRVRKETVVVVLEENCRMIHLILKKWL